MIWPPAPSTSPTRLDSLHAPQSSRTPSPARRADPFIFLLTIFLLACFVGYYVVWNVTPALHSPLMAVTNGISSVIIVGAMLATGLSHGFLPPSSSASSPSPSPA